MVVDYGLYVFVLCDVEYVFGVVVVGCLIVWSVCGGYVKGL